MRILHIHTHMYKGKSLYHVVRYIDQHGIHMFTNRKASYVRKFIKENINK